MKKCVICKHEKELSQFNLNRTKADGLQPHCRDCGKKRSKRYYKDNRDKHKTVIGARKSRVVSANVAKFRAIKDRCKCANCTESDSVCLDFHHIGDKDMEITKAIHRGWSWTRVVKELEKCIVFCANCHRKFHAGKLANKNFERFRYVDGSYA